MGKTWGRADLGGPCGVWLKTPPAASVTRASPNERPGRSEGQERGWPQWPHEGNTIPEGTPGVVWGLMAGAGLRAMETVVPVLGLSPSPSEPGDTPL